MGNSIAANVMITDSATTNEIANSINTGNFLIVSGYTPPSSITLTPSHSLPTGIDSGQQLTYTAQINGGLAPYTFTYNFVNATNVVTSTTFTNVYQTQNTLVYTGIATNTIIANVIVTDAHPTTINSIYTGILTVNQTLVTPSLSPLVTSALIGQSITYSVTKPTTGTPNYGYNWLIEDSSNNIVYNTGSFVGTSSLIFSPTYASTYTINVIAQDSALTPEQANSIQASLIVTAPPPTGGGGVTPPYTTTVTTTIPSNSTSPIVTPLIIPGEALFVSILNVMFKTTYSIAGTPIPLWIPIELVIMAITAAIYKAEKNKSSRRKHYGYTATLAILIIFLYLVASIV